jgi:hypothetical protein
MVKAKQAGEDLAGAVEINGDGVIACIYESSV